MRALIDVKACTKCKQVQDLTEFHKDVSSKDGRTHWCKTCANANTRGYHARNKKDAEYQRRRHNRYTTANFGISSTEYTDRLSSQPFCAICQTPFGAFDSPPHLDHDHTTGKLREFLCNNCNRGLGHLQENMQILENALLYLRRHKE